jgi:dipeptide/tripeptide permease
MSSGAVPTQRTFLGHPIGLYVLFFTEMWERFSYYGMRALLILYMVNYFRWEQKDASTIYKVYTSFVYVTPILGGYLADRFLGNRKAVIIGAVLMAIGHFLMAFEAIQIFYAALIFLILGNGFFKPNMSTQVGRLYPANDGRRDGAYTIFYMGINLGAFLAPLACGWLQENTVGGYHSGFTLAGIGMVCGLVIYLVGQPFIKEIDPDTPPVKPREQTMTTQTVAAPLTEAEASRAPSVLGFLYNAAPGLLVLLGVLTFLLGVVGIVADLLKRQGVALPVEMPETLQFWNAVMLTIGGVSLGLMAYVCGQVTGGVRDRVLAILVLGVFVIFFWAAFEQAGNVLNVWADKNTDRYLTRPAPQPSLIPEIHDEPATGDAKVEEASAAGVLSRFTNMFRLKPAPANAPQQSWGDWLTSSLNPVPTAWFQSINALAIFLLAPLFAWLWVWLDSRGQQPSIPGKMTLGLLMMSASVAVMIAAANQEGKLTTVPLKAALPDGVVFDDEGRLSLPGAKGPVPFHAGLLVKDGDALRVQGVLPDTEAYRIIAATAPAGFKEAVEDLKKKSETIGADVKSVEVRLADVPPGFDMKYAGVKKSAIEFNAETRTLTAFTLMADKEVKGLLVAAGDPTFRATVDDLYVKSNVFRISPWWLVWSYILATLGELCLSPVGLSMVSKLAPAKFATMLMGVWMLTSSFGNFAAGALGEVWGTIPPVQFFLLSTVIVGVSSLVLFFLVRTVVRAMHGVN